MRVSRPNASYCPPPSFHPSTCLRIHVKTSTNLQVRALPFFDRFDTDLSSQDGGWLNSHPLPSDKGSFGNFEGEASINVFHHYQKLTRQIALAQQNKQVIQQLLETEPSTSSGSYDDQLLLKLRDFYSSCLNEDKLNEIGSEPLIHFVQTLKKLYSGNDTKVSYASEQDKKIHGLTAATAFLHSRGTFTKTLVFNQPLTRL